MPERLYDAALPNEIANLPEVGPFLMYGCEFDFSEAIANDRHIFLHDNGGIAICSWSAPRIYECHLFFRPETRGRGAIDAALRMIEHMREYADALWAQVPIGSRAVAWIIRQLGFASAGTAQHPQLGPVEYFTRGFPCRQS